MTSEVPVTPSSPADGPARVDGPAPSGTPEPAAVTPALAGPELAERLERYLGRAARELVRPRVRTVVVGALLILLAATVADHSVWTLPLAIVGIVMIVVAWVGSRMEGRLAIEWGEAGAGIQIQARFRPPAPPAPALTASFSGPAATSTRSLAGPAPEPPEMIDGEAHTIELDLDELRALVAAAEQAPDRDTTTTTVPVIWRNAQGREAA